MSKPIRLSHRPRLIWGSLFCVILILALTIFFRGEQENEVAVDKSAVEESETHVVSSPHVEQSAKTFDDDEETYYPNGRKIVEVQNPPHGVDGKFEEAGQLVNDTLPEKERISWVQDLLFQMKTILKNDDIDWSSNADVIHKLLGYNEHDLIFLYADHPAINEFGELTDRWGSPYFFHALSSSDLELRSAGADLELFTDDDIVTSNMEQLPEKYRILNENITRP